MTKPEVQSATGATTHKEHGERVAAMFGRIAGWYDFLNHALSGCQDIYWRYRLAKAARPKPGETVLDLAAGTMDVSVELKRQYPDCKVAALDFALPMLENGKAKKLKEGREEAIFPVQADGRSLPLASNSMGAATIAFGIRNILPREDAYKEFYRVLKPGARLCILEFGTGSKRVWKGVYNFYLDKLLPFIGDRISGDPGAYRYLAETIKTFPDERALAQELVDAGFEKVYAVPMMSGIVYLHVCEKPLKPKAVAPKKVEPETAVTAKKAPVEKMAAKKAEPKKAAPKTEKKVEKKAPAKKAAPKKVAVKKEAPKKEEAPVKAEAKPAAKKMAAQKSAPAKKAVTKAPAKETKTKEAPATKVKAEKAEPKKETAPKAAPKKETPQKEAPKKAAPKKEVAKKAAPEKSEIVEKVAAKTPAKKTPAEVAPVQPSEEKVPAVKTPAEVVEVEKTEIVKAPAKEVPAVQSPAVDVMAQKAALDKKAARKRAAQKKAKKKAKKKMAKKSKSGRKK